MFFLTALSIFFSLGQLSAASLNGTASFVYKPTHHIFSNGDIAQGFVRMGGGFTIKSGAKATLDTVISVSGPIDLRETGILQLVKDLKLDSGVTWSSGGYINGRGNSIVLNGPLSIPASKKIYISGDTIIDGQGSNLILNEHAQFIIENKATLTLKNLMLSNVRNSSSNPCIKIATGAGRLSLDNLELSIKGDMNFSQGHLHIHNDVAFTGTSAFIYTSTQSSYIAPSSTFLFDIGTTFSFAPQSTNNNLFVLQDRLSSLFFNGSSLKVTSTGMRITSGNLFLNNKVLLQTRDSYQTISSLSALTSMRYGTTLFTIAWNPAGTVIAIGGLGPSSVGTGFANLHELKLYSFNGLTLTPLTSQDWGSQIESLSWNPAGTVLAVGGYAPSSGFEVQLYSFDGSTLTPLTTQDYGGVSSRISSLAWNPAGTVLAIGGQGPVSGSGGFANTHELRLYSFDGSTLTALTSQDYGGALSSIISLAWNPAGTVLAIGGQYPVSGFGGFANTDELRLYSFDGSTLTALTSQDYGTLNTGTPSTDTLVRAIAWNPAGTVIAVGGQVPTNGAGGFANTDELRLYSFNGSTLTALTSQDYGTSVRSIDWDPSGKFLAVGGDGPTNGAGGFANTDELRLYGFDGSSLTALTSQDYGTSIRTVAWNPAGTVLAIGGSFPTGGVGGFPFANELRLYGATISTISLHPAVEKMLIFGNSALGADYDLNVAVLGNKP